MKKSMMMDLSLKKRFRISIAGGIVLNKCPYDEQSDEQKRSQIGFEGIPCCPYDFVNICSSSSFLELKVLMKDLRKSSIKAKFPTGAPKIINPLKVIGQKLNIGEVTLLLSSKDG